MADFDLTQTDAQVQSILNDAQDAQGAGAQTTLTTDYIMLKDTSGNYHKILKDSFTEACRNVLAGLLVNNDKGTTISQIPAIASGDFGSVTPANLASVLGGQYNNMGTLNTTDFATVVASGNYKAYFASESAASTYHCPIAGTVCLVVSNQQNLIMQFVYGSGGAATRSGSLSTPTTVGTWGVWTRCDNFGYNSLSDLASALGGGLRTPLAQSSQGAQVFTDGLYYVWGEGIANARDGKRYALVVIQSRSDGYQVWTIGDAFDFGTDSSTKNLLYEIRENGVAVWKGSSLPCYIRKLA